MQRWRKMKSNLFLISKNGFRYILYAFVTSALLKLLDFDTLSFLSFLLIFLIVYFFRNPEREVTIFDEGSVVSPVDGTVVSIEDLLDSEYGYKVVVKSSYFDIGVLRVPFDSSVASVSQKSGACLPSESVLSKDVNTQVKIVFNHGEFNQIQVKHILSQSFAPLDISMLQNQNMRQSTRYGFMLHGVTEIYLPRNFRLNINNGDKLTASESLLGFFIAIP